MLAMNKCMSHLWMHLWGFIWFWLHFCFNLQNEGRPSDKKQHVSEPPSLAPLQSAAYHSAADLPAIVSTQQQQLQPQSPLIQEVVTPGHVETRQHAGQQLQEAGQAHAQTGQQDGEEEQSEQHCARLFDKRLQALEASSRRTERKVDQILEFCRTMAQAMSPA